MDIAKNMRTVDGKVPNYNQRMAYIKGDFDLVPVTAVQGKLESIREIVGVDPNTPEGRVMIHDFNNSQNMSDMELEKTAADIRNIKADAALRERELDLLGQGIDPKTGKPLGVGTEIDPKELIAGGKAFTDAFNGALGPLGFPTQTTTAGNQWWQMDYFTRKAGDNPKLLSAIFGNGIANPESVRRELLAVTPAGRKLETIDFPSFDAKTNMPTMVALTIDQAVPLVTQMRRSLTTSLPPVFAAMRQMSPQTLAYMISGNPVIEQAAKAYAPDIAQRLADARAQGGAGEPSPAESPVDPNLAPLLPDIQRMQKEMSDIRQLLQGQAAPPRTDVAR